MFIVIEGRNFSRLTEAMDQLESGFTKCNPKGVVSRAPDFKVGNNTSSREAVLVVLREPYRLVDCLSSTKETREFYYEALEYLHGEYHHLAISLREFRILSRRLRVLTDVRIKVAATRFRLVFPDSGGVRSGILGKDTMWEILIAPQDTLPSENLEPDEDPDNKILVTIESQSGREDYLAIPEKPFTIKDGRTLIVTPPDLPAELF